MVAGKDFFVAHCPERMNPGDKEHNIFNTKRIVGGSNAESLELAKTLYESVGLNMFPVSNLRTAELVKLVENTQRDVNIAFMSEIALLSEKIGVNVKELVEACSTKWNFYKLLPGAGVGGHCLPNNPYYILKAANNAGVEMPLMMTARRTNDQMMQHVVDLVERVMQGKVAGKKIALLGVAYKANVDDVRQAPSRFIAAVLKLSGAEVVYHDPLVNEANGNKIDAKRVSLEEALSADCLMILCKHDQFKQLRPEQVKAKAVVDCCFLFEKKDFDNYAGVGNA
ncbi:nucleotide sugar dehydrogenase [Candidatus Micrarchaeota archaeon]|nr:nucleotide sugar dehydrogenase [Candidatus Micrarchaeota archaeon]